MKCVRQITNDIYYVGGSDRRLSRFENCYPIPDGVAYNSYILLDEKTVLLDTVDHAISRQFIENIKGVLSGKNLDYIVINHMEPDHCAMIEQLTVMYPEVKLVLNKKTLGLISQFYGVDMTSRSVVVKENEVICFGRHSLKFIMAPMVHWPEVMFTYDETDKILFSADAFGSFGALDGRIFNDEIDYKNGFMEEARRYYSNIVGRYGAQVQSVFKKLPEDIEMICPLHGPVWREDLEYFIERYKKWSSYEPEEDGVFIAYASMYGNTELAVSVLANKLAELGITKMKMVDVASRHFSYHISDIFKYSTIVFAAPSYNTSFHPNMSELFHEMKELNVRNRAYVLIENGSWAPSAVKGMQSIIDELKDMKQIGESLSIKSSVTLEQEEDIERLAELIVKNISK